MSHNGSCSKQLSSRLGQIRLVRQYFVNMWLSTVSTFFGWYTFQQPNTVYGLLVYVYMRINYEPFIIYIKGSLSNFLGSHEFFGAFLGGGYRKFLPMKVLYIIKGRWHPETGIILKKFSVPRACFTLLYRILLKYISAFKVALIIGKANFVSRWPQINWPFAILRALHSVLFL